MRALLLFMSVSQGLGACASAPSTAEREASAPHHGPPIVRDGATGAPLGPRATDARLDAPVVFVAEQHASPGYQAVQREILEHLHARGRAVAVAVEWLPAAVQPAVDAWLAGEAPIAALAEAVDWPAVWGHELHAYAPILLWARRHGAPVIALNAPAGLARAVAQSGPEGVSETLRPALPPLDTGDERHFQRFAEMMRAAGHGHAHGQLDDETLRRYYLAQLVWDESMSRRAAEWLASPAAEGRTLVVFAGTGHVDFGDGVPARLRALTGLPFRVVRPFHQDELGSLGPWPGEGAAFPDLRADLLWRTP